jgi:hypothetical protein
VPGEFSCRFRDRQNGILQEIPPAVFRISSHGKKVD